ncbi:hypothetical protein ACFQAT_01720 [Undibacterium arcticum]
MQHGTELTGLCYAFTRGELARAPDWARPAKTGKSVVVDFPAILHDRII